MKGSGFRITRKKGFHVTFENDYTVSVQFGPGNYCNNYDAEIGGDEERCGEQGSHDAEVAVIDPSGNLIRLRGWTDTVRGRQTPKDVLRIMKWAERQKKGNAK